jgi:hypothetical protein
LVGGPSGDTSRAMTTSLARAARPRLLMRASLAATLAVPVFLRR